MNKEEIDAVNRMNIDYAIAEQNAQDAFDYYTHVFIGGNKGVIFTIHNS